MPPQASKTIFVANLPFEVSEEQLANVFGEAGPVAGVEIKFDPDTGRSRGYAFVQFYDEATAASAVRNLKDVLVNGRNLRVESSTDNPIRTRTEGRGPRGPEGPGGFGRRDDTPPSRNVSFGRGGPDFGGPGGGPGGMPPAQMTGGGMGGPGGSYGGAGGPGPDVKVDLSAVPPGIDTNGQKATDAISATLATISPGQMQDVMAGMKTLITTQPEQARALLQSKPQLAYALFQAMLLMNIVDPSVLQRITPVSSAPAPAPFQQPSAPQQAYAGFPPANAQQPPAAMAPPPAAQQQAYPPFPPQNNAPFRPPSAQAQGGYGGGPPAPPLQQPHRQPPYGGAPQQPSYGQPAPPAAAAPPAAGIPPEAQAMLAGLPEDQKAMLMQVLMLSPAQVQALDPGQRDSVMQLRRQFLGAAA